MERQLPGVIRSLSTTLYSCPSSPTMTCPLRTSVYSIEATKILRLGAPGTRCRNREFAFKLAERADPEKRDPPLPPAGLPRLLRPRSRAHLTQAVKAVAAAGGFRSSGGKIVDSSRRLP